MEKWKKTLADLTCYNVTFDGQDVTLTDVSSCGLTFYVNLKDVKTKKDFITKLEEYCASYDPQFAINYKFTLSLFTMKRRDLLLQKTYFHLSLQHFVDFVKTIV